MRYLGDCVSDVTHSKGNPIAAATIQFLVADHQDQAVQRTRSNQIVNMNISRRSDNFFFIEKKEEIISRDIFKLSYVQKENYTIWLKQKNCTKYGHIRTHTHTYIIRLSKWSKSSHKNYEVMRFIIVIVASCLLFTNFSFLSVFLLGFQN